MSLVIKIPIIPVIIDNKPIIKKGPTGPSSNDHNSTKDMITVATFPVALCSPEAIILT